MEKSNNRRKCEGDDKNPVPVVSEASKLKSTTEPKKLTTAKLSEKVMVSSNAQTHSAKAGPKVTGLGDEQTPKPGDNNYRENPGRCLGGKYDLNIYNTKATPQAEQISLGRIHERILKLILHKFGYNEIQALFLKEDLFDEYLKAWSLLKEKKTHI